MKASCPIFIQSQHPMQILGLPPFWIILSCVLGFFTFIVLDEVYSQVSLFGALGAGISVAIYVKIKMGGDRHSDNVWIRGVVWQGRYRTGKIHAGRSS